MTEVWAATYVLLGLQDAEEVAHALFEEVLGMEQSTTYQAIVRRGREEGRLEGARRFLLVVGEAKFGPPDAATRAAIKALGDLARFEELALRLITANSWYELLPPPAPKPRRSRRKTEG